MDDHRRVAVFFGVMVSIAAVIAAWAVVAGSAVALVAAIALLAGACAFAMLARSILERCKAVGAASPEAGEASADSVASPSSAEMRPGEEGKDTVGIKEYLLERVSHELRTPLTPVLVKLSSLQENAEVPEWLRVELASLRRNVEMESRLIDGMAELTRTAHPQARLRPEVVDVHELLERAVQLAAQDHDRTPPVIHRAFQAAQPLIAVDAARFEQACWNIIKNAMQYTPETGTLTIATNNTADGGIEMSFSDTGAGIEPDFLPHVFDAFERRPAAGLPRLPGLGLGLAVSKSLTEQMGGTLVASSAGSGRGSTFTMTFPPAAHGAQRARPQSPAERQAESGPLDILVVEDDRPTANVLAAVLRQMGHTVTVAGTVAEAIAAARTGRHEMLISDIGLPDGSGLDVQKWFRENGAIPCIALSGYGAPEDMERSREAGFLMHIVKPISVATLRWAINEVTADSVAQGGATGDR